MRQTEVFVSSASLCHPSDSKRSLCDCERFRWSAGTIFPRMGVAYKGPGQVPPAPNRSGGRSVGVAVHYPKFMVGPNAINGRQPRFSTRTVELRCQHTARFNGAPLYAEIADRIATAKRDALAPTSNHCGTVLFTLPHQASVATPSYTMRIGKSRRKPAKWQKRS